MFDVLLVTVACAPPRQSLFVIACLACRQYPLALYEHVILNVFDACPVLARCFHPLKKKFAARCRRDGWLVGVGGRGCRVPSAPCKWTRRFAPSRSRVRRRSSGTSRARCSTCGQPGPCRMRRQLWRHGQRWAAWRHRTRRHSRGATARGCSSGATASPEPPLAPTPRTKHRPRARLESQLPLLEGPTTAGEERHGPITLQRF